MTIDGSWRCSPTCAASAARSMRAGTWCSDPAGWQMPLPFRQGPTSRRWMSTVAIPNPAAAMASSARCRFKDARKVRRAVELEHREAEEGEHTQPLQARFF